jgi:hypothetical protein
VSEMPRQADERTASRLARWRAFSPAQRLAFVQAWCLLPLVWLGLRVWKLPRLHAWLQMAAHAWVECAGQPVNDRPDVSDALRRSTIWRKRSTLRRHERRCGHHPFRRASGGARPDRGHDHRHGPPRAGRHHPLAAGRRWRWASACCAPPPNRWKNTCPWPTKTTAWCW